MLEEFEYIVRRAGTFTEEPIPEVKNLHPFSERNIHSSLPTKVRKLFDDSYYSEATFEAFKYLDKLVSKLSGVSDSGHKLMMTALGENGPLKLNELSSVSDKDEQSGFRFMFAGAMSAVRNPRRHEFGHSDAIERCLDHLALASLFLRRLEEAGLPVGNPQVTPT